MVRGKAVQEFARFPRPAGSNRIELAIVDGGHHVAPVHRGKIGHHFRGDGFIAPACGNPCAEGNFCADGNLCAEGAGPAAR